MTISAATSLRHASRPFVGRSDEQAFIQQRMEYAQAGEPQIMLVSGDAGIGKSRLLQETRNRARRLHFLVGAGRAHTDMALPYLPFFDLLQPLIETVRHGNRPSDDIDLDLVEEVLRKRTSPPSFDIPLDMPGKDSRERDISQRGTSGRCASPSDSPDGGSREQLRLFRAVSKVVIRAAELRPTLAMIDDLHWADPSSAKLLAHLIFAIAHHAESNPLSLVIVAGFRPLAADSPVGQVIDTVRREQVASEIEIGSLNEADLVDLLASLGVSRPTTTLLETIENLTLGNPLFVEEIVFHLRRINALTVSGNRTRLEAPTSLQLPQTVLSAISTRTESVSPDCQDLLVTAACLGDGFSAQRIANIQDRPRSQVLSLLDEAIHAGIVEGDAGALHFAHPTMRHAFYNRLRPIARQQTHLRISQQLETDSSPEQQSLIERAHHLREAGPFADAEQVIRVGRAAGDTTFAICAWPEAARNFEAVIARTEQGHGMSSPELAELHLYAGRARFRMQEGDAALAHFDKAIELYRGGSDNRGLLLAEMDSVRVYVTLSSVTYGTTPKLEGLLSAMDAIGDEEERLRGEALALLAQAYWTARQPDEAIAASRDACAIGIRCDDPGLASDGAAGLALSLGQVLEIEESVRAHNDSVEYGHSAADPWREATGAHRLPLNLVWLGRLDEAEERIRQAEQLTVETQEWSGASLAMSAQVVIAVLRHQLERAEDMAARIKLLADRSRYPWGGYNALPALATSYYLAGELTRAEQTLAKVLEPGFLFAEPGAAIQWAIWTYQQLVRLRLGVTDQLRQDAATVLATIAVPRNVEIGAVPAFCALAELGNRLEDDTNIDAIHQVINFARDRKVVFTSAWVFLVPRVLAVLETRRDNFDRARSLFEEAASIAARAGAKPELGRVYLDHARLEIRRGAAANEQRVRELLASGYRIFRELGMPDFESEAESIAEQVGADLGIATSKPTASHAAVANREGPNPRSVDLVVIMTDMVDSTGTIARFGDRLGRQILEQHNEIVKFALRRFGAEIIRFTGDGYLATHTSPDRAIHCALEIQSKLAAYNQRTETPIQARIGMSYGPISPDGEDLSGIAVHLAARLCAHAATGEVLVSDQMKSVATPKSTHSRSIHYSAERSAPMRGFEDPQTYYAVSARG